MPADIRKTFPARLKALRQRAGYDITTFSEILGTSRQVASYYENGRMLPRLPTLAHICEIFDITPDQILGYSSLPKQQRQI